MYNKCYSVLLPVSVHWQRALDMMKGFAWSGTVALISQSLLCLYRRCSLMVASQLWSKLWVYQQSCILCCSVADPHSLGFQDPHPESAFQMRIRIQLRKNLCRETIINIMWQKMLIFNNILSVYFKGTVQREFISVCWHILIGLGLNKNCFWL
jgi:hypothetical protein